MIEKGLCECGCGKITKLSNRNRPTKGVKKGEPMRFIHGHNGHEIRKKVFQMGYPTTIVKNHPRAHPSGYVFDHVLIAEKALGKFLPKGAIIHHFPSKESVLNLVICQDISYHKLLHKRYRALKSSGHANWLRCWVCKSYDDPKNMYCRPGESHHRSCYAKHVRERYIRKNKAQKDADRGKLIYRLQEFYFSPPQ